MGLCIERLEESSTEDARSLLERSCPWDRAHLVAREKLFGPAAHGLAAEPLGARLDGELIAVASTSGRFLRLLAVAPAHRNKGVGSELLCHCEDQMRAHEGPARTLAQPGNYLAPGIDRRNQHTIHWLKKRGWSEGPDGENILIEVQHNARVRIDVLEEQLRRCRERGYRCERLTSGEIGELQSVVREHFSEGWAFELGLAATRRPSAVHIARHGEGGDIAAFAAHDGNNGGLGCFGPTGTLEAHRGKGLAATLLLACLLDVKAAQHSFCEVAWIGPRAFYDKVAGVYSDRHFTIMDKDLR